jgi:hypothetical protein
MEFSSLKGQSGSAKNREPVRREGYEVMNSVIDTVKALFLAVFGRSRPQQPAPDGRVVVTYNKYFNAHPESCGAGGTGRISYICVGSGGYGGAEVTASEK